MASNIANLGGYDCDFVEPPPDELLCLICTFVAREPMQMDCCGKVYCKACFTELQRRPNTCPNCRNVGKGFTDIRGDRNIKALKVKCDNLQNGCRWVGELASLDEHYDICDRTLVPCPNECKNGVNIVQVLRRNLETHCNYKCPNRSCLCPHCLEEGKHCDITTSHLETCPQLEVPCPNEGCNERLPRCEIPDHRTWCPLEQVACKYSDIGCEDEPLRKELKNHENDDNLHLHIAIETILKQQRRQTASEEYHLQAQCRLGTIESRGSTNKTTFKMCKFSQYKDSEEWFHSPSFYTHRGGYKMCLWVDANGCGDGDGTHVSVFAFLMRGENDDTLTWPFTGTVTVELLNQPEDKEHHKKTIPYPEGLDEDYNRRVVDGERSRGWGHQQFIPHSALGHRLATNCQYLKDDCLYFRVSVKTALNLKPWLACTV